MCVLSFHGKKAAISHVGDSSPTDPHADKLTLGAVIIAAMIDSINPCAFGVLIFLMLSLLKIGSSKRALKAGLIYTFVVFVVYFLAGFGIFKVIQQFTSITHYIYMVAGILVLGIGLWQFKDILLPDIGPTLQISPRAKPLLEKIIQNGTIPAMILLGIVVSLFELPCTGGIYLGVLTLMSINKTFGIPYLLLYNLIFVLPLIILTFLIYKGTSPGLLQKWTSQNRIWMKLFAGILLIGLGLYILFF
jgi:cytochrome c biogenesis protein CcdA